MPQAAMMSDQRRKRCSPRLTLSTLALLVLVALVSLNPQLPLSLSLSLYLIDSLLLRVAAQSYPSLSDQLGQPPNMALFPPAGNSASDAQANNHNGLDMAEFSARSVFCPDQERAPCSPLAETSVCLTRDMLESTFIDTPSLLESYYPRFDIEMVLETQNDPSSLIFAEMNRVFATELLGYSLRIIQNPDYQVQLPRCQQQFFDVHTEIWKTDWTLDQWNFLSSPDSICSAGAPTGPQGLNGWYTDTLTARNPAFGTLPLGYWQAYQHPAAVAGLPQLNLSAAQADAVNGWFIPPKCLTMPCGVAYMIDPYYEPGVPQQQAYNLDWLVALMFPPTHDEFFNLVNSRLDSGLQVLFMYDTPDPYSATNRTTRIALPQPTYQCYKGSSFEGVANGRGPVSCDFRTQNLERVVRINSDSDKNDAFNLFSKFFMPNEDLLYLLSEFAGGANLADVTCRWIRENNASWSGWISMSTPRKHELRLPQAGVTAIYVLMAVFLALSLLLHLALAWARTDQVILATSHMFNQLIVAGGECFYVALVVGIQPDTVVRCVVSQFLLSIGFCLLFGSLLIKSYRIDLIVNANNLKSARLPDVVMLRYLGVYSSFDLALVLLWTTLSTPEPYLVTSSDTPYALVSNCTSQHSAIFRALTLILRGAALVLGALFAIRIRGVGEAFTEAGLGLIVYNILIMSAVVVGITYIAGNNPAVIQSTWTAGVCIGVFASVLMLMVPKFFRIYQAYSRERRRGRGSGNTLSQAPPRIAEDLPTGVPVLPTMSPPQLHINTSTATNNYFSQATQRVGDSTMALPSLASNAFYDPHSPAVFNARNIVQPKMEPILGSP